MSIPLPPDAEEIYLLLVSTPAVLKRIEALNGPETPTWADIGTVTDEKLRTAELVHLTLEPSDNGLRADMLRRLHALGFDDDRIKVQTIDSVEKNVTKQERSQRDEDRRALRWKRALRNAEETLATEDAVTDAAPEIATFAKELETELVDEDWLINGLVPVDGRVVIGGFRKAGKTVLALNLGCSMVSGQDFLDRFGVRKPDISRTTCWLNLELIRRTARRWIHALGAWNDHESLQRLVAVHARGAVATYAITQRAGEAALAKLLAEHRVETLIIDPVAPLMSVCGLDVNKGQDVGRFLTLMDRTAHREGVQQVVYTAHVSKGSSADEGNETVKGDTRWEDAVDSIIILGRERQSGKRWIRAEGRDIELNDATLVYDETTRRLTLDLASRYDIELQACAEQVLQVVRASPGILTETLTGDVRIVGTKAKRKAGVQKAVDLGWIERRPGHSTSIGHWPLL